ncbi:hypothetical protein ruthe_03309 [Rubellimicrobium thermophilum DSM 16684]|uniref:Uncharacterized protein n=1 Tax=Rubellimicrobium thermophilum DSM 16684 TaxID=1123069 RepID=S9RWH5_9RHOB|nr:hypothetical protein ruthe_03309 [Rubellimicrobium thermophilum DSM 16684]
MGVVVEEEGLGGEVGERRLGQQGAEDGGGGDQADVAAGQPLAQRGQEILMPGM